MIFFFGLIILLIKKMYLNISNDNDDLFKYYLCVEIIIVLLWIN